MGQFGNPIIVDVDCGSQHTAAISDKGDLYVFGSSDCGQLGTGKYDRELVPFKVDLHSKIRAIACGSQHTLIMTEHFKVYASGNNSLGQLGIGNKRNSLVFHRVSFNSDVTVKKIAAGNHSAAISENGDLYLWGTGSFGEFLQPQKITGIRHILVDVSVGSGFGSAVDMTGTIYSWGTNKNGELGLGDYETRFTPTVITSLQGKKVTAIACGGNFAIALGSTIQHKLEEGFSYRGKYSIEEPIKQSSIIEYDRENISHRDFKSKKEYDMKRERSYDNFTASKADHGRSSYRSVQNENYRSIPPKPNKKIDDIKENYITNDNVYRKRSEDFFKPLEERSSYRYDSVQRDPLRVKHIQDNQADYESTSPSRYSTLEKRYEVPHIERTVVNFSFEGNHDVFRNLSENAYRSKTPNPMLRAGGIETKQDRSKYSEDTKSNKRSQRRLVDKENYNIHHEEEDEHKYFSNKSTDETILNVRQKSSSSRRPSIIESQPEEKIDDRRTQQTNDTIEEEYEKALKSQPSYITNEAARYRSRGYDVPERYDVLNRNPDDMKIIDLEQRIRDLEREIQNERESSANLKKTIDEERAQNKRYIKALEENHDFIRTLEEENKKLIEKNRKVLADIVETEKERDVFKRKYEDIQKKYDKSVEELNQVIREKEDMIEKLQEEQNVIRKVSN